MDDLEKTHKYQRCFLENLFAQLALMVDEVQLKYSTRVDKTFESIREIFSEKVAKLSKFEKEMKELEKDVRLNYSNIIKLMDLEPFYEIIYRYNKKLNTIKAVFNEFKGKPDEIPEDAVRVKSMKSQLGFVAGFGRKLENFFSCDDSFDSNNSSQFVDLDAHLDVSPVRDFQLLPALLVSPGRPQAVQPARSTKATQTEALPDSDSMRKKHAQMAVSTAAKDDLKAQAELLIKSVDTLICNGDSALLAGLAKTGLQSPVPTLALEPRHSKSITKGEIAKRIQAHFNTPAHVGKPKIRSSSNTLLKTGPNSLAQHSPPLLDKKQSEAGLARELDFEDLTRELGHRQRDLRSKNLRDKSNPVPASPQVYFGSNVVVGQPPNGQAARPKLNKLSSAQQSSGSLASHSNKEQKDSREAKPPQAAPQSASKTERLLQLYRKNKVSSAAPTIN